MWWADEQLDAIITILIEFLEGDREDMCIKSYDILLEIICHHPHHSYELEALSNPLLKDHFSHAIETVRSTFPPAPEASWSAGI